MKLGAVFPQTEIGSDPKVVRDFAQTVEEAGFDHLLVYDHVLGATHDREPKLAGPYTEKSLFHEPFVLFGYLAAATSRIELATGIIILPQRQTALVAKQAAEVDILSGGRLRLGIGVGWNYVEYDALNENFKNRGKRQEEQVEVLRKLWSEPVVSYKGEYHEIDRAGLLPLPERQIPIWWGGFTPVAYERGARLGDGFMFGHDAESAIKALEQTRGFMRDAGRDPEGFGADLILFDSSISDVGAIASELDAWKQAGGTHASIVTMNQDLANPQAHLDALLAVRRAAVDAGVIES